MNKLDKNRASLVGPANKGDAICDGPNMIPLDKVGDIIKKLMEIDVVVK